MLFLTALAAAATQPPQLSKTADCKPMLTLASRDREVAEAPAVPQQQRNDQPPRPKRRCLTLASA